MLRLTSLFSVSAGVAVACTCFEAAGPIRCPGYPDPTDTETAIFLGKVVDVYPADPDAEYARVRRQLLSEQRGLSPADFAIEWFTRIWGDVISDNDRRAVRATGDGYYKPFADHWAVVLQRVRFEIEEPFLNAPGRYFELYTGFGRAVCDPQFSVGERYLVRAGRRSSRWSALPCSASERISNAASPSLERLRAWRRGDLPAYLVGTIVEVIGSETRPLPYLPIRLTSGKFEKRSTANSTGEFDFGELSRGLYHLEITAPAWKSHPEYPSPADLKMGAGACLNFRWFVQRTEAR